MGKSKTPSYVLTLPLKTTVSDINALNKYFELSRKIYNALLSEGLKRYRLIIQSKLYQQAKKETVKSKRNKLFNEVIQLYGLDNFSLNKYSTSLRVNEFKSIDANTCQALSARVINAINRVRFGEAKRVYFIKYNQMTSIEGLTNRQGIRYRDGIVHFNKLQLHIKLRKNDLYAQKSLQDTVKFCRILRRQFKNQTRYYLQLVLQGIPPKKRTTTCGEVGIDIGTQTIGIASDKEVKLLELAPEINNIEKQKRTLLRKLDRQRRANNPNKFNEDGTIKRNKDKWINSRNYLKTRNKLSNILRKQASIRRQSHNILANYILSLGNIVKVEKMNFKGLQKRTKETTINEKTGRYNKKKRFGKSLGNKAPAMLLAILDNKLKYEGLHLFKIDTKKVKASQYNPFTDDYNKKTLGQRWNKDIKIQRDLLSALIIKNVIIDEKLKLDKINKEKLLKEFDNFKKLHNKEILRLKELKENGYKLISSMGI